MAILPNKKKGYIAYLDNLFTNIKLLKYGKKKARESQAHVPLNRESLRNLIK